MQNREITLTKPQGDRIIEYRTEDAVVIAQLNPEGGEETRNSYLCQWPNSGRYAVVHLTDADGEKDMLHPVEKQDAARIYYEFPPELRHVAFMEAFPPIERA